MGILKIRLTRKALLIPSYARKATLDPINAFASQTPGIITPSYHNVNSIAAGVNRLFPDILGGIFKILMLDYVHYSDLWNWITVTHVCQYWRTVALDCPSLWSYIDSHYSKEKMEAYLDRSENADLRIDFRNPTQPASDKMRNLIMILEHIERISELRVSFEYQDQAFWEEIRSYLQYPAPRLEIFIMYAKSCFFLFPTTQNNPHLHTFRVGFFNLPPRFSLPNNLVYLTLDRLTNVNPKAILACLESSPRMKALVLDFISWTQETSSEPYRTLDNSIVSMSFLQRLTIRAYASSKMQFDALFRAVKFPDDLDCSCLFQSVPDPMDSFLVNGFYVDYIRAKIPCQKLTLEITPRCVGVFLESDRVRGTWDDYGDSKFCRKEVVLFSNSENHIGSSYFEKIGRLIRSSHLVSVKTVIFTLNSAGNTISEEDWFKVLLSLPLVRAISLIDSYDPNFQINAGNFARALAHQIKGRNSSVEGLIICPKLECLTIDIANGAVIGGVLIRGLEFGLRERKQFGFRVRKLQICSEYLEKVHFADVSKCVEELEEIKNY